MRQTKPNKSTVLPTILWLWWEPWQECGQGCSSLGPMLLSQSHQPVQGGLAEHMLKEKLINHEVVLEHYRWIFSVDEFILVKVSSKDDSTDWLVLTLVGTCETTHLLSLEERPGEEVGYLWEVQDLKMKMTSLRQILIVFLFSSLDLSEAMARREIMPAAKDRFWRRRKI